MLGGDESHHGKKLKKHNCRLSLESLGDEFIILLIPLEDLPLYVHEFEKHGDYMTIFKWRMSVAK